MYTGYYRVNYDARNWQLIGRQLMSNHTAISVINRAQIMSDALNLARAGLLNYETALDLTKYLEHENEYLPWESALTAIMHIDSMMRRASSYGLFKVNAFDNKTIEFTQSTRSSIRNTSSRSRRHCTIPWALCIKVATRI